MRLYLPAEDGAGHEQPGAWGEAERASGHHTWVTLAGVAAAASAESSSSTAGTATTMQAVVLGAVVVPGAAPMWDLSVANVHTFAVGYANYVVHNCDLGAQRVQHVVDNMDTLAPGAKAPGEVPDISEKEIPFRTNKAGNMDVYKPDIRMSNGLFEVGGPAKYADPTDDQIARLAKAARDPSVNVPAYLALDVTSEPVPASLAARAARWGIHIIEFTL